ncbi:marR-family transcription regulator [Rhodopirellula maiorica SM1]|uniref:MarR-family transcription regulator n=1 Tax=Rhodopirellula maiorica SM1 TaxID=1265738 RepID=M5RIW0_9BACT|nr:MarR family transcriptional regulator [Rhodopirellula maiorica]EMI15287.1 marR-family transcription regulator [Rhodopirellula maiorica SM1]
MPSQNLQNELHRKHPFASLQQEALVSLLRTGDQLENRLVRFFRDHDLTLTQFNMLRILQLEGRQLTCGEIKQQMIQVVPAITGVVDRLEKQGRVERQRCSSDRRVVYVSITKQGQDVCKQAMPLLEKLESTLLKRLTEKELKQLISLLEKSRQSLAEEERQ